MSQYPSQSHIKLLDHGFIALTDHMASDLKVARAARVKPEEPWRPDNGDGRPSDPRLIRRMMRERHTTPFEHCVFEFWIKAPIMVYRQWHRHRTQSYNEQSMRYMTVDGEFYIPDPKLIGIQSPTNHQSRIVPTPPDAIAQRTAEVAEFAARCAADYEFYRSLLKAGWPRELARMKLPVNIYSQMTVTVNLHNLFHFLSLRADPHAQHEIRVYADAIWQLITPVVPVCVQAWRETKVG